MRREAAERKRRTEEEQAEMIENEARALKEEVKYNNVSTYVYIYI